MQSEYVLKKPLIAKRPYLFSSAPGLEVNEVVLYCVLPCIQHVHVHGSTECIDCIRLIIGTVNWYVSLGNLGCHSVQLYTVLDV